MIVLSPNEQMQHSITFNAFQSKVISAYYLNVLIPAQGKTLVRLDGNAIASQPVPGDNDYNFAQLAISAGDHTLVCDSGFIAYVYGYGIAESYGYSAGASVKAIQHFVMIHGRAVDKKSGKPLAARIVYQILPDGREAGMVNTNDTTGEYTAVLPTGYKYAFALKLRIIMPSVIIWKHLIQWTICVSPATWNLCQSKWGKSVFNLTMFFYDLNMTVLRPESYPELDRVVKLLKENPAISIAISGHTDNIR